MYKTLYITEKSVSEAWLHAMWEIFLHGQDIKTQYDKNDDYPSKDATTMIVVSDPLSNPIPFYQKRNNMDIYCHEGDLIGIESILSGYNEEITKGKNDFRIGHGWDYTYHNRICEYPKFMKVENNMQISPNLLKIYSVSENINQINEIIRILKNASYSRRAQGITWQPTNDLFISDPPCLQRIWCRVLNGELTMQTEWRSRDLYKAWEANVNGMLSWGKLIAEELNVKLGTYVDFSNSLHIYGTKKEFESVINFFKTIIKKGEKKGLDPISKLYKSEFEKKYFDIPFDFDKFYDDK